MSMKKSTNKDKRVIIIRGPSGCGKTTTAKSFVEHTENLGISAVHLEADQFFYEDGEYKFDGSRIQEAHDWCLFKFNQAIEDEVELIVVANTFTRIWEFEKYIQNAGWSGYGITILECLTNYGNIHNVPDHVVQRQYDRFEKAPTNVGAMVGLIDVAVILTASLESIRHKMTTKDKMFHLLIATYMKEFRDKVNAEVSDDPLEIALFIAERFDDKTPQIILGRVPDSSDDIDNAGRLLFKAQPDILERVVNVLTSGKDLFKSKVFVHYSDIKRPEECQP